jgi:hypothetical protein
MWMARLRPAKVRINAAAIIIIIVLLIALSF